MRIFSLVPYSKTSNMRETVNWNLVIFDNWFDLGRRLDKKYEFNLMYLRKENSFILEYDYNKEKTSFHVFDLPRRGEHFRKEYFIRHQWLHLDPKFTENEEAVNLVLDKYTTKFKYHDKQIEVTVSKGERYCFAPDFLYFNSLKLLWSRLLKDEDKCAVATFSEPITIRGKKYKFIKIPFIVDLMFSWIDFHSEITNNEVK